MIKIPGAFEQPRHYLFIPSRAKIPPSLLRLTPGAASERQFLGCRSIFLRPLIRLLRSVRRLRQIRDSAPPKQKVISTDETLRSPMSLSLLAIWCGLCIRTYMSKYKHNTLSHSERAHMHTTSAAAQPATGEMQKRMAQPHG